MTSFAGKVVLVTGATSGIGETAAAQFLDAGATVFALARSKVNLDAARARHPKIRWLLADVSDPKAAAGAIDALVKEAGHLDVLVNNAAVFLFGPLAESSDEMIRSHFEINVMGPAFVTRAALPALIAAKGTIVNISSAAGHKAVAGGSIYGATKAALESLTKSWALELAPLGVRVNAIAPGPRRRWCPS